MNLPPRVAHLFREPSTWRGIIYMVAGVFGVTISTSEVEVLINAAFIIVGGIGAFVSDDIGGQR